MPWSAYCAGMATPNPAEYLELDTRQGEANFSEFSEGGYPGFIVKTQFRKIRIDPAELTPGEKLQRDAPLVPDGAPETMFFSARLSAEPGSRLYAAPVKAGANGIPAASPIGLGNLKPNNSTGNPGVL